MAKVRKMIGKADLLPIYQKDYPEDYRLKNALNASNEWLERKMKLAETKKIIKEDQIAVREVEGNSAAQAAARAIGATTATINTVTSSLGLAFYGSAAIAYLSISVNEKVEVYDEIAARECNNMEEALRKIAIIDESNPTKIN